MDIGKLFSRVFKTLFKAGTNPNLPRCEYPSFEDRNFECRRFEYRRFEYLRDLELMNREL